MSSSILKTATGSMEYSESDSLRAFRLFLELITPVEFSRLLIARAQHLLRVWPPQTAADTTANKTVSSKPNSLSFESIFAFLTFFRTQDSPELPSGDLTSSTSVQTLYNHLVALERLLSVSSPREIQSILRTRLDDIVEDRDTIIQGLLDVLRSNTEDDAEDESSKQGNTPEAIDIFIPRGVPSSSKFVTEGTRPGISEAKDKENSIEGSPQKRRRTVAPQETELDFEPKANRNDMTNLTTVTRSSVTSGLANVSPRRSQRISGIEANTSSLPRTRLRSVDGPGRSEKLITRSTRPKRKAQDEETSGEVGGFKTLTPSELQPSSSSRPRRSNVARPSPGNEQDIEKILVVDIPQNSHGEKEISTRIGRPRRPALPSLTDSSTVESRKIPSKTIAVPRPRGRPKKLPQRSRNEVILDKDTGLSETEGFRVENKPTTPLHILDGIKNNDKSSHSDMQMASNGDDTELSDPISEVQIRPTHPSNLLDKGVQSIVTEPPPNSPSLTSSDERASPPGPVLRAVNWTNGRLSSSANAESDDVDGPDDDSMGISNVNGNETPRVRSIPSTPVDVASADLSPALYGQAVGEQHDLPENTDIVELSPPSRLMRFPKDGQISTTSDDGNEGSKASPLSQFPREGSNDTSLADNQIAPVTDVEDPSGKPYQSPQGLTFAPNGNTPQYSPFGPHSDSGTPSTASIPPYYLSPPVQTQPRHTATLNTSASSAPLAGSSPSFPLNVPQQQQTRPDTFPYRTLPLHPVPTGPLLPQSMSHPHQATSHFGPPPPPQYYPHYPVPQAPQGSYSSGPWMGTMLYVPYRGPSTAPPTSSPISHFGPPPYGSPHQYPYHPSHPQHSPYPPPQHPPHPILYHNPYPPPPLPPPPPPPPPPPHPLPPQPYQKPHPLPQYQRQQPHHYEQPVLTDQQQHSPSHVQSISTPISPPRQEPIPPPSGPSFWRASMLAPVPTPHRTSSPPVKPPEGPKRNVSGRRTEDEENSDASTNSPPEIVVITYTDEAGMKETSLVRRRCHNCRAIDAPSWRKSKLISGKILCNKCGIYESTHQAARPLRTRPRRGYYVDTQKKKKTYKRDVLGFSEEGVN